MTVFIGVDPGASGGVAAISDVGVVEAHKMPEADRDLLDLLTHLVGTHVFAFAMIENVHSSPMMGVSSAFSFGRGYGALTMALVAAKIPYDKVTPRKWQPALGIQAAKGDGFDSAERKSASMKTAARKAATKRRAQELFPHMTITHAISDALLIAEYCRRVRTGLLSQAARAKA